MLCEGVLCVLCEGVLRECVWVELCTQLSTVVAKMERWSAR